MGDVRRAREAPSAASGAVRRSLRERCLRTPGQCDLAGTRSTPLGASHGPKAAPGGLGLVWRWSRVTLGVVGVSTPH